MASGAVRNIYRLYVGNIPWTISSNELKQYFSKFGHVNHSVVVFDKDTGLSRNYGFVNFSSRESFEKVLNHQNHSIEGINLRVQPSHQND